MEYIINLYSCAFIRVWIFGPVYCKINNYVSYMTVSLNVFTLLAISVDRRKV